MVDGITLLPESFRAARGELNQGELKLVAAEASILNLLPAVLQRYTSQYPNIKISLSSTLAKDIPLQMKIDEADFAIGSLLNDYDYLQNTPVYSFQPVLLMAKDHPLASISDEEISLKNVAIYGLIMPPEYSYTAKAVDVVFKQHNLNYTVKMTVTSSETAKRFVEAGVGVAILTEATLNKRDNLRAVPFGRYFHRRSYGLIQRRGRFLSPQAEKFKIVMFEWASEMKK